MTKILPYREVDIDNLEKYIREIKKFRENDHSNLWFRGHCSNKYVLEPSIYRDFKDPNIEKKLMSRFKLRSIPYLQRLPFATKTNNEGYWEWLFLMQHYKLPTRLLDWTENAMLALAFAVLFRNHDDSKIKRSGAHVWCIDPIKLNKHFNNFQDSTEVPNINENTEAQNLFIKDYSKETTKPPELPMAVIGPQNNQRIVLQKGVFTIFPFATPFKFEDKMPRGISIKLKIRNDSIVKELAKELLSLGISETMVYPELDYVSCEIKREYENV